MLQSSRQKYEVIYMLLQFPNPKKGSLLFSSGGVGSSSICHRLHYALQPHPSPRPRDGRFSRPGAASCFFLRAVSFIFFCHLFFEIILNKLYFSFNYALYSIQFMWDSTIQSFSKYIFILTKKIRTWQTFLCPLLL